MPQQALFLMNSPFVVEQAQALAARPEVAAASDPTTARSPRSTACVFSRQPDADELAIGQQFLAAAAADRPTRSKLTPWEQYAQLLLLTNEVMYVD